MKFLLAMIMRKYKTQASQTQASITRITSMMTRLKLQKIQKFVLCVLGKRSINAINVGSQFVNYFVLLWILLRTMRWSVSIKLEIHVASEKLRNFLVFCVNSIMITLHKQNWTDTWELTVISFSVMNVMKNCQPKTIRRNTNKCNMD